MEVVVVERSFDEPVDFDSLDAKERAAGWCLAAHHVRFLRSFLSRDGKRMICLYEAPDAESVRASQRQAGMPFEHIWTASVYEASR